MGLVFSHLASGQTTFVIKDYPANTPQADKIYMSGDFEGWSGGQIGFQLKMNKGFYCLSFPKSDKTIHYKFTRGSWDSVEVNEDGKQIANRSYSFLEEKDSVFIHIEKWDDLSPDPSTVSKNVHLVQESFKMETMGKERTIYIYLPENYKNAQEQYPVLYMHDGQNLFDQSRSYSGEWEVDETMDKLGQNEDLQLIVVGIDNGGMDRIDEYSPWTLKNHPSKQEGDAYIKFITQNLKPYIDQNYRTLSDKENTGIMGSSLGGLISFYAALQYPEIFGRAGIFSPSFELVSESNSFAVQHGKIEGSKIYFLSGDSESEHMVSRMEETMELMINSGFPVNNIKSKIVKDGQHNEKLWREGFENAVKWLYSN